MSKAFCVIVTMVATVATVAFSACHVTTETECEDGGDTWVCPEDEQGSVVSGCVCDVNEWNGYGPDPLPW